MYPNIQDLKVADGEKSKYSSVLVRNFFRPISYYFSWVFVRIGFSSNKITFLSGLVAFLGGLFISINLGYIGSIFFLFWPILDCCDGTVARFNKKGGLSGSFIDALFGYFSLNMVFIPLGILSELRETVFFSPIFENINFIIIGSFASVFDLLSRLSYQKYLNYFNDDTFSKKKLSKSNYRRIGSELALAGFLSPLILFSILYNFTHFVLLFYFLVNLTGYVLSVSKLILKTIDK